MSTVTINGRTISCPNGASISIHNGVVKINGKIQDKLEESPPIEIHGNVRDVESDSSVTVNGDVGGNVQAGGSVSCVDVGGSVQAGGSVSCDDVFGSVSAGGRVNYG